jgi:UDP-4-amino-4,6-dideoxy-N-acetyl-beta-L-altrosamine N-acetyltransferase
MTPADGPQVLAWRNSEAVAAFMYTDHRIGADEHARWLAAALAAGDRRYWIVELDGAPVGVANLAGIDRANRRTAWAFYLGEPSARGRGVGAVVEAAVLEYAFNSLDLHKIWCEVLVENAAVLRLHERFGFRREALFRDHVLKGGRMQDVVGLGLLRGEWDAIRRDRIAELEARGLEPVFILD